MKITAPHWTVTVAVVFLCNLIHTAPARADGCPAPSFAAPHTFGVGSEGSPFSLAIGDLNGDGNLDVIVANYGCTLCSPPVNGSVSVLVGKGDGTFQSTTNYDTGPNPQSVTLGDFNGDGKPDVVVTNFGSTNIAVLLGNGDATFQAAIS